MASSPATASAAGYDHSCTIRNGRAYCWGGNRYGQLANADTAIDFNVPETVAPPRAATFVGGNAHKSRPTTTTARNPHLSPAIAATGGSTDPSPAATATGNNTDPSPATTIAAGTDHSCMISRGMAYCWGNNAFGQLGNTSIATQSSVPVPVDTSGVLAGKTLTQITAGDGFTCALDSTGAAYCWGYNNSGQLGNNSTTNSPVPVAVMSPSKTLPGLTFTQITAGQYFMCGLDNTGAAYCWGANGSGQLGPTRTPRPSCRWRCTKRPVGCCMARR